MAKLGSKQNPAVLRVKTMERAQELMALCKENGWQVTVGVEPGKREDISDLKELQNEASEKASAVKNADPELKRNELCHCGSGKKFKHCHGKPSAVASEPAGPGAFAGKALDTLLSDKPTKRKKKKKAGFWQRLFGRE